MGDPESVVLLYSQYSEDCGQFIETANKYGVNYITPICVDNVKIRETISKTIKYVPTLLFIFKDGMVDTYQGEKAMLWLSSTIRPIQEQLENKERRERELREEQKFQIQQELMKRQKSRREEEEEEEEEKPIRKPKVLTKQSGFTAIDDEMDVTQPISPKKKSEKKVKREKD